MKAAPLNEIRKELNTLKPPKLLELCMRLAKYKKENKELLGYLLFESDDEQNYIKSIKEEIDIHFENMKIFHLYFATKSVRKVLRLTNKYIKYSGSKETEAELLIYFLKCLKNSNVLNHDSTALENLYQRQIQKIHKAINTLHEDLQHDYLEELQSVVENKEY